MRNLTLSIVLLVIVFALTGCDKPADSNAANQKADSSSTPETESETPNQKDDSTDAEEEKEITVEIASWDELQDFISSQKGKVVVLDIWSSSCLPCIKEYPNLVKLQKEHPEDITCVSFNTNYYGGKNSKPEDEIEEVLAFLKKKKSDLKNYISSTPDEDLYKKIELASIPVVYVYNKDGKLEKRFDNDNLKSGDEGFDYEKDVNPLVEKLLKK